MSLADDIRAVRSSVVLSRPDHILRIRVAGEQAYHAVTRVFAREIYLRDGQISHGLLLHDDGRIFADCYLANDEGDYLLFAEGPSTSELTAYLDEHVGDLDDVEISSTGATRDAISVDGPYAWELMSYLVGPEVVGLPYLTFFYFDDVMCCRAGKTGEYGYMLVAEPGRIDALWAELLRLGEPLDVRTVTLDTLDLCALESWFFNIRAEGTYGFTPLELQLQWRVTRKKAFVGSAALERLRSSGIRRRLTCVVAPDTIEADDPLRRDGAERGLIVNAAFSPTIGRWVGLAMIDLPYAFPGVDGLQIGGTSECRTVTPPVLSNRSLYVNPQRHSYASRHDDSFPPLVAP